MEVFLEGGDIPRSWFCRKLECADTGELRRGTGGLRTGTDGLRTDTGGLRPGTAAGCWPACDCMR